MANLSPKDSSIEEPRLPTGLSAKLFLNAATRRLQAGEALFVAGDPGAVFAFAIACVRRAPPIHPETCRAEISDLYVAPSLRRRGCGRALVAAALDWARARGAERVEVRVSPRNPEAQAFWRAAGYGAHMEVLHRRI